MIISIKRIASVLHKTEKCFTQLSSEIFRLENRGHQTETSSRWEDIYVIYKENAKQQGVYVDE